MASLRGRLGAGIDLRGDKELIRTLDALPSRVESRVLRQAVRRSIGIYRKAARHGAPRGETGNLRRYIKTYSIKRRGRNRHSIGVRVSTGTRTELRIPQQTKDGKTRGYYPTAIEYGWTDRGGNRHAAKPYMRPAWHSTQERMRSEMISRIRSGLQKIVTK